VWDYHCLKQGTPVGLRFMDEVHTYEKKVLAKRA
jgi:L-rhamnose isomerase